MKFILGKKKEMAQKFGEKGEVLPVTIIEAGPCWITQIKTKEKDGYQAVQLGFEKLESKKIKKSKKTKPFRYLREFRGDINGHKVGGKIKVDIFKPGEKVQISGFSKGKGFQGVVKRHHFHGSPASHGHKDQLRMPGSIGATDAARVFKGKKMAGRMGSQSVTVKNLEIIEINPEKNQLIVKGAVPGARNGLLEIQS